MDKNKIKKKIPISLTLFRIVLAVIICFTIFSDKKNISYFLFTFAVILSFFDTFLEKRRLAKSHVKALLDPLSDKLLINLTAIALFAKGLLPPYIMLIFLIKDILMVGGAVYTLSKNRNATFQTHIIDRLALLFQAITLMTAISLKYDYIIAWIAVLLTIISGIRPLIKSEIRFLRRKTDLDEFKFRKLVKLPDFFTLLNAFSGLLAIGFAINESYGAASIMFLAAVFFDWVDGKVARFTTRNGEFGKQLDSLSDTISFGVAPVIFGFSLIQTKLAITAFTIFLFCGILRLARYNISEMKGGYQGMPITINGVIIPLIYFIGLAPKFYPYIYLASAALMVSSISVKKLF